MFSNIQFILFDRMDIIISMPSVLFYFELVIKALTDWVVMKVNEYVYNTISIIILTRDSEKPAVL